MEVKNESQGLQADLKPIHTILLDTSPILLNTPSISTLLANCHTLVTTQSVIDEIKGEEARTRFNTLYRPFLSIRSPKDDSIKFVREFARKTGDSGVLSGTDFEILALAYDLECERNAGDWRLRRVPGQKRLNGSPPSKHEAEMGNENADDNTMDAQLASTLVRDEDLDQAQTEETILFKRLSAENEDSITPLQQEQDVSIAEVPADKPQTLPLALEITEEEAKSDDDEDDDDGWITPSNIKRHQAKDDANTNTSRTETKTLQVATMTGDFAMQNVLLQMNLNLLSTKACKRVAHIKQLILRCYGCFNTTKDMSKQFCPRCGKDTLTRVTCTTNDKGEVRLHLKANHQWNNRGNVFSIPKPVSGSANQKWKGPRQGGGQGGWGTNLILTEDQKEYVRAVRNQKRTKQKDLMDEDLLPSILSGNRGDQHGGRIRVGGGRNINARKR